ncbi:MULTISPECIES: DUF397 domain-containing protein [unclassified Streptomyces]|uniref:DUF397 domain-containing protein n=1 Tax=unclassified Streptomyces TaxID=2593676 RepID=UPI002E7704FC|nr:DUF397 domain-containing protein [Streptomyces sp. JV176]MEE1801503.1 DUF397 domain-containing protein [Streptomyces sp. JV176]
MRNAPELSIAHWRKSSYSNPNGGECLEITEDLPGLVPVRDSKLPHSPIVIIPARSWTAFVTTLKA